MDDDLAILCMLQLGEPGNSWTISENDGTDAFPRAAFASLPAPESYALAR